ncbi:MAG TPA: SdpI family protein [Candidatus Kapabacteria bacterium]|nr:SdpI family protein [Candidatus Kapabacteria bacterium]
MKRNFIKDEWLQMLILIAPFLIMALVWDQLPDRIPIRWNFRGHPKGYGPIYVLPLLNVGLAALLIWLAKIDPKARKMNLPSTALKPIRLVISVFFLAVFCLSVAPSLGWDIDSGMLIPRILIPLLFLLIGNYLPAIKPNYFIGIRTPWTLENPENWRLTHQFGGRLWMMASVLFLILNFLFADGIWRGAFGVYLAVLILPPLVYSYVLFQKSKHAAKDQPAA